MRRACVALLSAAVAVLVAQSGWAEPRISFTDSSVIAEGITPGGQAVWFSVARERPAWTTIVVRRQGMTAADLKGRLVLPFDSELSGNSAWVVVDLTTGSIGGDTPEGMSWQEVDFPGKGLAESSSGLVRQIEDNREYLEILVVRPGEGAWGVSVGDGGETDADGSNNGVVRAAFEGMRPVAASLAAPVSLLPGDLIVAIDPRRMELYATIFGKPR